MKTLFIFLLSAQASVLAQPAIKNVIIQGQGAPMLMLNGGTADMSVFDFHAKKLSGDYKVIRMEQFNVQYATEGLTLPANYSVRMESDAIMATLDSIGIKEEIVVVGHSYGGLIALDLALNNPDRIRSLVLIEPPVFGLPESKNESPAGMKGMQDLLRDFVPAAEITEERLMRFRCNLVNCDTTDIRQHPLWTTWIKQKNRLRGLSAATAYKVNLIDLHRFQKPVLIITGTRTVPFHKRIDELLAAGFSTATTARIEGGHGAVNENPDQFIRLLNNFIKPVPKADQSHRR